VNISAAWQMGLLSADWFKCKTASGGVPVAALGSSLA